MICYASAALSRSLSKSLLYCQQMGANGASANQSPSRGLCSSLVLFGNIGTADLPRDRLLYSGQRMRFAGQERAIREIS
jgi:hypothetical protein